MVETCWDRIKPELDARGWGVQQLASALGVSYQAVAKVRDGGAFGTRNNLKAAELLGVRPEWLATGKGDKHPEIPQAGVSPPPVINLENNPDYPAVRRVAFKLSAGASGFGIEYHDEEGAPIVFQRQWYEGRSLRPEKLFAVRVGNDSMQPGLHDGDTVIVNTEVDTPKDGVVFAINYEGELVIKRLMRDGGQWWLTSDNPDQTRYPRKVCHEGVKLVGEIVHKQSERI